MLRRVVRGARLTPPAFRVLPVEQLVFNAAESLGRGFYFGVQYSLLFREFVVRHAFDRAGRIRTVWTVRIGSFFVRVFFHVPVGLFLLRLTGGGLPWLVRARSYRVVLGLVLVYEQRLYHVGVFLRYYEGERVVLLVAVLRYALAQVG